MILKGFNVCRLNDSVVRCRSHGIVPIKASCYCLKARIKSVCSCDTISLTSIQFVFMTDFLPLYRICSAVELSHNDAVQVPVLWPWELCIRTREKRPENPSSGQIAEWLPDEGRTNISVSDTNLPGSLYSAGNSLTWPPTN